MFDRIIDLVIDLRIFIIVTVVVTVMIGTFLLIYCRKFSFDGKNIKTIGFFYHMKVLDTLALAIAIAKVCLFISLFVTLGKVCNIHIAVYILLHLIYMIHRRDIKSLPADIFIGVTTCGVMSITGVLYNYLRDVMFDWRIQVEIILMMIIICGYALCDLYRCCGHIIMIPKVKGNKDERATKQRN